MALVTPSSTDPAAQHSTGCFAPTLFAMFLLAGGIVFYAFFLDPLYYVVAARNWPKVPCNIRVSRLEAVSPDTFRADIKYFYLYGGKTYPSTRVWFIRSLGDTHAEVSALLKKYPENSSTWCYVNPRDPAFAVLERGFRPQLLIALVPAGLAIIGLVGLFATLRPVFNPPRPRTSRNTPSPGYRPLSSHSAPTASAVTFRQRRRLVPTIGVILLAVAWNWLMWYLVREVADNWRDGVPHCYGLLLTLFAVPLLGIGLLMLVLAGWMLLRLLNPRPILTLSAASVPPGGGIDVAWRFRGRVHRIRRLRLFFNGREEAIYQRGTNTVTDREEFFSVTFMDTREPAEIHSGSARLVVPADALPTFHAPHNRIAWVLRIVGDIPRWPDLDEEFEIMVVPAESIG